MALSEASGWGSHGLAPAHAINQYTNQPSRPNKRPPVAAPRQLQRLCGGRCLRRPMAPRWRARPTYSATRRRAAPSGARTCSCAWCADWVGAGLRGEGVRVVWGVCRCMHACMHAHKYAHPHARARTHTHTRLYYVHKHSTHPGRAQRADCGALLHAHHAGTAGGAAGPLCRQGGLGTCFPPFLHCLQTLGTRGAPPAPGFPKPCAARAPSPQPN